ncbi:CPCC family cysteine-rich protein [Nannocystis pusilla]|uniref:CPCC family cysteine-rich protein n=1 Tax=Nannocystis pusilla TaxID=889268 RepID=UPI003BF4AB51
MARRGKPRATPAAPLTPEETELLAEFTRRRAAFEADLAASNILHHVHTCPTCGFPTLSERASYELCAVCLWEDDGEGGDPNRVSPPNGASPTRARLHASEMLRRFEQSHALDGSIDDVVRAIKAFVARWRRGDASIVEDDFTANLRNIVPTRPRSP